MIGDEHADAALLKVLDDALDIADGNGVHTGKGLIQQDEFGLHGQRAGDFHAAPLATGEGLAEAVAQMLDMKLLQQFVAAGTALASVQVAACLQNRQDVVAYVHTAKNRRLLRQVADAAPRPLMHGQAGDAGAVDFDASRIRAHDPQDHVKARCLARAIRPQQTDHLSTLHAQADIFDYRATAIGFGEITSFQNCHRQRARWPDRVRAPFAGAWGRAR